MLGAVDTSDPVTRLMATIYLADDLKHERKVALK